MSNEAMLAGLVAGYAAGSLATYALLKAGASWQARRARHTPATTAAMPLAFAADSMPRVSQEIRRIVPDESPTPPDHYTFPLAAEDGTITRETVSARYLLRFVMMPDVSRAHWSGEKGAYSQLLRIAAAHGWIERVDGRAWTWAHECRTLGRRVMKLRDSGITLPSPGAE